jgi:molybdenum cofactor cytidylyltransferase
MNTPRVAALILAAGLSTRMKDFKPLLPLGETTVIDHALATFRVPGVDSYLVVGHRREEVRAAVSQPDVSIIPNPDYQKGMFSSVQAGVRNLRPCYPAFFLLPGDIPMVSPATIAIILDAGRENPGGIIYPVFEDKRGHPPLIPAGLIPEILTWDRGGGLKAVLRRHESRARDVPVADAFILRDINTPEDYEALVAWQKSHPRGKASSFTRSAQ